MKQHIISIVFAFTLVAIATAFMPIKNIFTADEQQRINIPTKGLFSKTDSFSIDFSDIRQDSYSFPLPIGKAERHRNESIDIISKEGDAVKAMFDGTVRLSRKHKDEGNVIVIRHDNGLETVYGNNSQNLVRVGQHVKAGQTIAIVGNKHGNGFCNFSIMVNGGRINPETILEIKSHHLRSQVIMCHKKGKHVDISVVDNSKKEKSMLRDSDERNVSSKDEKTEDLSTKSNSNSLNLSDIKKGKWAYPLPGSHVISPYGGRRRHSGVDVKTKPNDKILAAFDGIVMRSGPFSGYGNFISIMHSNGLETRYSHQSRNYVKKGQKVKAGQTIGLTGRTGRATTEHLHFEVFFHGKRIDPAWLFNHNSKTLQPYTLVFSKGGVRRKAN